MTAEATGSSPRAASSASESPPRTRRRAPGAGTRSGSREKILRASKALFLESGYDGVNLDRIAERAEVARQTVYNHFGSKEAVFRATMQYHWGAFRFQELGVRLSEDLAGMEAAAFLRRFSEGIISFIEETDQVSFTRLVIAESGKHPWIAQEFYDHGKAPLLSTLSTSLQRMTEAGALTCRDPELAAHQFLGLVQEFVVWPQVMTIGPDAVKLPPTDVVVEEAVTTFLSRYAPADRA